MEHYFSFDVESMGLFGQPFSVGWVIVDEKGEEHEEGYLAYPHPIKDVNPGDLKWMKQNVLPHLPEPNCKNAEELYEKFWAAWKKAVSNYEDITMVADVPFPVEANFLLKCAKHLNLSIEDSPYPLLDVASIMLATGRDPMENYGRLEKEKPAHNPVNDARQSVRLMLGALKESLS